MKKISTILILLLSIFTFKLTVLAEPHAGFFAEDDNAEFTIYGDGAYELQTDDYTFKDVTSKIKSDSSKMDIINNYGNLVKAYELKINKNIDYDKYLLESSFDFNLENDYKKLGLVRMKSNGQLDPAMSQGHDCEDDLCYYSYRHILGDGLFLIIESTNNEIKLVSDMGNIKFNYFKYKNYTDDNLIFLNLDEVIKNRDLIKTEANKRGINIDEEFEEYESDYIIDGIARNKNKIIDGVTTGEDGRKYLGTYGFQLLATFDEAALMYSYPETLEISKFKISLKENDNLKNYTDFNVYGYDPYGYIKVNSGTFEEYEEDYNPDVDDEDDSRIRYYYYDSEENEYNILSFSSNGYVVGQPISPDDNIVEYGSGNYTLAYFKYFSPGFSYYTYDGSNYNYISDYNYYDLISEYGEPVYVYSYYKKTTDTIYQLNKSYIKVDDYGNTIWLSASDYLIGQDIKKFENTTGLEVYKRGTVFPKLATGLKAKNGYISFDMSFDYEKEDYPVFIVSGVKKETYNEETEKGKISFEEKPNLTLIFKMDDIKTYSSDDIKEALNLSTQKSYDNVYSDVKKIVKDNLIEILNIEVKDSNDNEYTEGPFNIKIKMTDDMKKYKSFKLVNIKNENNDIVPGDEVSLKEENGYLVGKLDHLSVYALLGSQDDIENPNTVDNIVKYFAFGIISLIGIIGTSIYIKKNKAKKIH